MAYNTPTPGSIGVCGDGSDGAVTFDGTTVILGLTPVLSVYTLARDIYLGPSTINSGVTINTNGFRVFCNATLTNNGTIAHNGNSGLADGTLGAALANTSASINAAGAGSSSMGLAGASGQTGVGSTAVNGSGSVIAYGGTGGAGGTGGSAGGSAGTLTTNSTTLGSFRSLPFAVMGGVINSLITIAGFRAQGGSGGGGGGGDGSVKGGGGGGGGGVVIVSAYNIVGTGNIRARGGNGGSPASGTNCGGGGAGGGGLVIVVSRSIVSGAIAGQTIDANHGTPGTPQGSGSSGGTGNNGTVILLQP